MSLSSGIFKRYKKEFVLDEDGLRRIEGVLLKAAQEYEKELNLTYRVEREDDRFYETHDISDVLEDPNIKNKKIKMLGIDLREKDNEASGHMENNSIVRIIFDKEDEPPIYQRNVIVSVSSQNKTWALIFADEIESQIVRLFKSRSLFRWLPPLFMVLLILVIYKYHEAIDGEEFNRLKTGIRAVITSLLIGGGTYVLAKTIWYPKWVRRIFGPESVFLWGEEEVEYLEREKLRKNIHWTILVGYFVSFFASMATILF